MDNNNNQQTFWQFSDQLRVLQTPHNLSLNDSIWSTTNKRTDDRRNLDIAAASTNKSPIEYHNNKASSDNNNNNKNAASWNTWKSSSNGFGPIGSKSTTSTNVNFNHTDDNPWKFNNSDVNNGDFNKGIYSSQPKSYGFNFKNNKGMLIDQDHHHHQIPQKGVGKKNRKNQKNNNKEDDKNTNDKRFKTLPPAEALPRNETIGGYIFVCNNDTMEENLKRQLFGLPPRYRDSVRAITPGLPLFLYNYSTHQLHGVYQAASFGGTNIELNAFEDKKCPGESRFPAQVRAITRKVCLPLEEDSFRPILHHYDGPKFRLELTVPEVLSLLDIFDEQNP
ncbi:DCD domain-containing protein NRP [Raphanus sativus]|uniref:DCD domain-containing protein NRP n=1 Tax=Raphanus sativus TaxID=3726 RepID=A0A6J0LFC6_RAPSA|nr:DCD domain-containing protein NRP [Raphanus sativus]XP_056847060.1 DCD domain-containing protein NRP [Raphanus sativus]